MKIIIVGCGRVGKTLAEKLNEDGNDVTVIDMSAPKVKELTEKIDVMGVVGNGATHTVQVEAGVSSADLLIAVTNSDELNLLCCMIAKKESNCQVIARVKRPEYSEETAYLQQELDLAMVINPEYEAAEEIARVLRFPNALKIEPFAKGKVELIKFRLPAGNELAGKSVKEAVVKYRAEVLVCTVQRGEESFIANGDFVFEERDVITLVATEKNAADFFAKIHFKGSSIKNAMLVGGGVIAQYLCGIMEKSGVNMKIIEKDKSVCEELAGRWTKYDVIHGDAGHRDLLMEEGLKDVGAFVALATADEENILLSLFAKEVSQGKLITKINHADYDSVITKLELDTTICPTNITSDTILRFVRSMNKTKGCEIETLHNVIPGEVEAAEFIVKENSPIIGKPLYELRLKKDVLVASIYRDGKVIVPRGADEIRAGDSVVIVTKGLVIRDVADVLR